MRTKNLHFDFDVSETLVDFCLNYVTGVHVWETLLHAGARAMLPTLDPLHRSTFAQEVDGASRDPLDQDTPSEAFRRLTALEKIVFAPPTLEEGERDRRPLDRRAQNLHRSENVRPT